MRIKVIAIFFLIPSIAFPQAKRALSLIEKDKRLDAYELLNRSLVKDSLASAEHFVLAGLFIDDAFEFYDIDSAYNHILIAFSDFEKLEPRPQSRLIGSGFTLVNYDTLKKYIESQGFERAKDLAREEDYIRFIELFPEADQLDSAVILRDRDAFRKASLENTYNSYQLFFNEYPSALDANEAQKRYQYLLYQDRTASGKLADLVQFLKDFPETWHRLEVEKKIFDISTGRNTTEAYMEFINGYPTSYLVNKAKLYVYNLSSYDRQQTLLKENYFNKDVKDSLLHVREFQSKMILLSKGDNGYELLTAEGHLLLDSINQVAQQNKCNEIEGFLLINDSESTQLINLQGEIVASGEFESYEDVTRGFVKLSFGKNNKLIWDNGDETTGKTYSGLYMAGGFIVFEHEGIWGLESVTGIRMLEPQLDTLFEFHDYLISSKSGNWGIHKKTDYYPLLDKSNASLNYPYDSLAVVRNEELFVQIGSGTGLLDRELNQILALGEPEIELLDDGYFLETNDSILDSRLAQVWYSDILSNKDWTIGQRSSITDIYYKGKKVFESESASLIGNSAVRITNENKTFCYFTPDSRMELKDGDQIKPIRKMGENSVVRHYLYTDQRNRQSVIDETGKRIKIPRFDRLIDLGEDYMIFSVKGLFYNILDNQGKIVLENVDAATSLDSGYISYLSKGKFGLLNNRNSTQIEPKYDKPIRRFSRTLFLINEDDRLGLIDRNDSVYVSPKFEEIHLLNDSLAVLKSNFRWTFWSLNEGKILLDNVSDYWQYNWNDKTYYKIFKGIGYGIWRPEDGLILNSTYSELEIKSNESELVFITEKWVEEADLVIILYYNQNGELFRKSVLSTEEYEELQCLVNY